MKNVRLLLLLIIVTLSASCASTYSGPEKLPVHKYEDALKGKKLSSVNVVYKKYKESSNEYSIDDTNKAADIFSESGIFSKVGFGEEDMPVQMRVSYRQIGNYNIAQEVFIGATLGMIPQKIEYMIELSVDTFVGGEKTASHKYDVKKIIQGSAMNTKEWKGMEKDALVVLLDRFFMELLSDTDLLGKLRKTEPMGQGV